MFYILSIASVGIVFIFIAVYYNKYISYKHQVEEAWSGIDVHLKKRYSLIPNLMELVRAYSAHEKELLENLTKYRSMGLKAKSVEAQKTAENKLTGELSRLFAVAEKYPELKSSKSFLRFHNSLEEIENEIEMARRYYNATVRDNNTALESFPGFIFARVFHFNKYEYFDIDNLEHRSNVKINL